MGRNLEAARGLVANSSIFRFLKSCRRFLQVGIFYLTGRWKVPNRIRWLLVKIPWLFLFVFCLLDIWFSLFVLGLPLNLVFDLGTDLLRETMVRLESFLGGRIPLFLLLAVLSVLVLSRTKDLRRMMNVLVSLVVLYMMFGPLFDSLFGHLPPYREFTFSFLRELLGKSDSSIGDVLSHAGVTDKDMVPFLRRLLFGLICLILILHPIVVLSSLVWSYLKMRKLGWNRRGLLKARGVEFIIAVIPPLFFSFVFVLVASMIIVVIGYAGPELLTSPTVIPGLIAITITLFVAFGLTAVLPITWYGIEWVWWSISFGGSTTAKILRRQALRDFQLSVRRWETDRGFQAPIAFLRALGVRLFNFPYLHCTLKRMKDEKEGSISDRTIKRLNRGWKSGEPPELLEEYMDDIMKSSRRLLDERQRLHARSAVASVRYLMGDIKGAAELAIENWERAKKLEKRENWRTGSHHGPDSKLRWWASYAYLHTKSLSGRKNELRIAMKLLAEHWDKYYVRLEKSISWWNRLLYVLRVRQREEAGLRLEEEREKVIRDLRGGLVLNPALFIPRRLLLTAAFNGGPVAAAFDGLPEDKKKYWPSVARDSSGKLKAKFNKLKAKSLKSEQEWVERWYEEARKICEKYKGREHEERASLPLSHAYAGFYFTLLCLDERCTSTTKKVLPRSPITAMWSKVDPLHSPTVSVAGAAFKRASTPSKVTHSDHNRKGYIRSQFYGIYQSLYLDKGTSRGLLKAKATAAFHNIKGNPQSTRYTQYLRSGFYGIYELAVEQEPQKALDHFRNAARYSDIRSDKSAIVDCLFMCCRAVAAERTKREKPDRYPYQLEANHYLKEVGKLAAKMGSRFFFDLYDAARYEVSWLRLEGDSSPNGVQARKRLDAKRWRIKERFRERGTAGDRILQVFWGESPLPTKKGKLEALGSRLPRLQKAKTPDTCLDDAIKNLNEGWRSGFAPKLLEDYMAHILELSENKGELERLHARCAVASVKYLMGDTEKADELARENWRKAEDYPELRWSASYAYFNTTAFGLGEFESAMEDMAGHWNVAGPSTKAERKAIATASSDDRNGLVVNPRMSTPRNLILAAAFNEAPISAAFNGSLEDKKKYWPSVARDSEGNLKAELHELKANELRSEQRWLDLWYEEAKEVCGDDSVSRAFSDVCAGFYFILLSLDRQCDKDMAEELHEDAEAIFDLKSENIPAMQYVKSGFHGIHKLVAEENPEQALDSLRKATRYSQMSGNRFAVADSLFLCCRAVAAQRTGPYRQLEADRYLDEAEKVAEKIGANFYFDLRAAARSEVMRLRGDEGETRRLNARLRMGQAGERILRVFRKDFRKHD